MLWLRSWSRACSSRPSRASRRSAGPFSPQTGAPGHPSAGGPLRLMRAGLCLGSDRFAPCVTYRARVPITGTAWAAFFALARSRAKSRAETVVRPMAAGVKGPGSCLIVRKRVSGMADDASWALITRANELSWQRLAGALEPAPQWCADSPCLCGHRRARASRGHGLRPTFPDRVC
jgi:hypothetical protein